MTWKAIHHIRQIGLCSVLAFTTKHFEHFIRRWVFDAMTSSSSYSLVSTMMDSLIIRVFKIAGEDGIGFSNYEGLAYVSADLSEVQGV